MSLTWLVQKFKRVIESNFDQFEYCPDKWGMFMAQSVESRRQACVVRSTLGSSPVLSNTFYIPLSLEIFILFYYRS